METFKIPVYELLHGFFPFNRQLLNGRSVCLNEKKLENTI